MVWFYKRSFLINILAVGFSISICYTDEYTDSRYISNEKTKVNEPAEWIDPGDMLNDLTTKPNLPLPLPQREKQPNARKVKAVESNVEEEKGANCEKPYFKQLTRFVLDTFESSGTVEISENHLTRLKEFLGKDDDGEVIYDVLDIIFGILTRLQANESQKTTFWSNITLSMSYNQEFLAVGVIIIVLIIILLLFENRTAMSWQKQFWYLLSSMFVISIPWEWFRIYRQEFAKKQAAVIKEMPDHCFPNNMTILRSVSLWLSNLLKWQEDECGKYQEAILVDPVWEVSPSQAFSITVTRFFAKPLEYIAEAVGKSLNKLFVQLPVHWQPFMFITIVLFLTLCLLLFTNSRIKFGFFEIGPSPQNVRKRLENEDIAALEERIGQRLENIIRGREGQPQLEVRGIGRIVVQEQEQKESSEKLAIAESKTPGYDAPFKDDDEKVQELLL